MDVKDDNHGTRAKIQPLLYRGIVSASGAEFYTPFFIKSDVSNRSYWLFHFSSRAKARDEMVKLHWEHKNTFVHYGRAGLHMLGYNSDNNNTLFSFDEFAKELSLKTLSEDLPRAIYNFKTTSFENLKNHILNTTPATVDMLKDSLLHPMDSGEVMVTSIDGAARRSVNAIKDTDIISCHTHKQGKLFL